MSDTLPSQRSDRTRFWWLVAAAPAAAVLVYANSLHNPFAYDDHRLIVANDSLRAFPDIVAIALHEITRPLINLTYAIDWSMWGLDPFGFHVTSVLLHAINAVLVLVLAWNLADDPSAGTPDHRVSSRLAAATAALVFAVHPMMTQAVGYISGRSEVLCATFLLLTLLSGRRFVLTSRARWALAAGGAWILAMLSKEVAAVAPLLVIAYDRMLAARAAPGFRGRFLRLYGPMLALTAIAAVVRLWILRQIEYPADSLEPEFLLVQLEAVRRYALLLLGHGAQSVFHHVVPLDGWLNLRSLATLATIPAAALIVWGLFRLHRAAAFGALWFLLLLVPSSALFVLGRGEAMAEHRVYTASIGFFVAAGALVGLAARVLAGRSPLTRRTAAAVGCVLLLQLAMQTVLRNTVWSDPVRLWQDSARNAPGHWLPRLMLGEAYLEAGRCDRAIPEYRLALRGNPDEPTAYSHLGGCLLATNRVAEAAQVFAALNARYPASAEGAVGLSLVAVAENRFDDARGLLRESLRRDTGKAPVQQLLSALDAGGDLSPSPALCLQVSALLPGSPLAARCAANAKDRP